MRSANDASLVADASRVERLRARSPRDDPREAERARAARARAPTPRRIGAGSTWQTGPNCRATWQASAHLERRVAEARAFAVCARASNAREGLRECARGRVRRARRTLADARREVRGGAPRESQKVQASREIFSAGGHDSGKKVGSKRWVTTRRACPIRAVGSEKNERTEYCGQVGGLGLRHAGGHLRASPLHTTTTRGSPPRASPEL